MNKLEEIAFTIMAATLWWYLALFALLYKVVIWIKDGMWPVVTLRTIFPSGASDFIYSTNLTGIQIFLGGIFDTSLLTMLLVWLPLVTAILIFLMFRIFRLFVDSVKK